MAEAPRQPGMLLRTCSMLLPPRALRSYARARCSYARTMRSPVLSCSSPVSNYGCAMQYPLLSCSSAVSCYARVLCDVWRLRHQPTLVLCEARAKKRGPPRPQLGRLREIKYKHPHACVSEPTSDASGPVSPRSKAILAKLNEVGSLPTRVLCYVRYQRSVLSTCVLCHVRFYHAGYRATHLLCCVRYQRSVWCYTLAMPCPAMPGTDLAYGATRYQTSTTRSMALRMRYSMSGTDMAYAASRGFFLLLGSMLKTLTKRVADWCGTDDKSRLRNVAGYVIHGHATSTVGHGGWTVGV
eukprot:14693-Rhodomonas_salina.1